MGNDVHYTFKIVSIGFIECFEVATVDVKHSDWCSFRTNDGHNYLRARERTAGNMPIKLLDVGHNQSTILSESCSANSAARRNSVAGRSTLEWSQRKFALICRKIESGLNEAVESMVDG